VDPVDPASRTSHNEEFVDAIALENVRRVVASIPVRSRVLHEMRFAGKIDIVGGFYDVTSGSVEILSSAMPRSISKTTRTTNITRLRVR